MFSVFPEEQTDDMKNMKRILEVSVNIKPDDWMAATLGGGRRADGGGGRMPAEQKDGGRLEDLIAGQWRVEIDLEMAPGELELRQLHSGLVWRIAGIAFEESAPDAL